MHNLFSKPRPWKNITGSKQTIIINVYIEHSINLTPLNSTSASPANQNLEKDMQVNNNYISPASDVIIELFSTLGSLEIHNVRYVKFD
jgi:hypothetical protein